MAVAAVRRPRRIGIGADALNVMVVAFLGKSYFGLETQDLCAILAQPTVHLVLTHQNLLHPVGKGIEHQGMILQILRMKKLDFEQTL